MLLKLLTMLTVVALATQTGAQTMSALQPFVSSTPLIKRSQVVEELYSGVQDRLKNVEPGLQADFVMKELDAKQAELLGYLAAPVLKLEGTSQVKLQHPLIEVKTIDIDNLGSTKLSIARFWIDTKALLDADTGAMKHKLDSLFKVLIQQADPKGKTAAFVGPALGEALKTIIPNAEGDLKLDALAILAFDFLYAEITNSVEDQLKQIPFYEDTLKAERVVEVLNTWMASAAEHVRKPIESGLHDAREQMLGAVESLSSLMVEGNVGLSLAAIGKDGGSETGSVLAGVSVSLVKWPKVSAQSKTSADKDIADLDREISEQEEILNDIPQTKEKKREVRKRIIEALKSQKVDEELGSDQCDRAFRSLSLGFVFGHELGNETSANSDENSDQTPVTNSSSRTLIGGVGRMEIYRGLELAICGAAFVGAKTSAEESASAEGTPSEAGGGLSYTFPKILMVSDPIIGIGYFQQFNIHREDYSLVDNAGIWFSRASANALAVYVGVAVKDNDWALTSDNLSWVTRFNFPILVKG